MANTLAVDNEHLRPLRKSVAYECGSVSNGDKLIKYDLVCLS
jgi:hypothetical protein